MPASGELAAVLFDMDGTICDTEPRWIVAEHRMAAEYQMTWTNDDAYDLVGNSLYDTGETIRRKLGIADKDVETVVHELIDHLERVIAEEGFPWLPGAIDLLSECNEAGVPVALVTMSWRRNAQPVIDALPHGRFDAVVTGDTVEHGKPHPEPYVVAARALGVDPADCVAIEDSAIGAASAQAAGCTVLAVPQHVAVDPAPRRHISADGLATTTLSDLRDLHRSLR